MPNFVPHRMCAGCRERFPKDTLLRIVKTADQTMIDPTQKMPGRGVYVCKKEACIRQVRKKKAFSKQFRMAVPDEIYEAIEEHIDG